MGYSPDFLLRCMVGALDSYSIYLEHLLCALTLLLPFHASVLLTKMIDKPQKCTRKSKKMFTYQHQSLTQ